nr:serine protein kinase RIO [Candidatus Njordarchaeum guaymaensis]
MADDTVEKLEQRKIDSHKFRLKRTDDLKSTEGVIDQSTLFTLNSLMNKGLFKVIHGVVATGKEANVYWAENAGGESFALKIYRTSTADFRHMREYVIGDPRFKRIRRGIRSIVFIWAEKEFKNLKIAAEVGVRVPKPIAVEKNVLVMEFIGQNGVPAPRLKDSPPKSPSKTFKTVLRYVKLLYSKGQIVHADLSEYNILVRKGPVVIDISQAVHVSHPLSKEYLKRDLENIVKYFSSLGVSSKSVPSIYEDITGEQYSLQSNTRI